MPPKKRQPGDAGPRREKPIGRAARFVDAKKNNNDLLADCERLLLREAENFTDRRQDVIHASEMSHADWCPRATYLRIKLARAGTLKPAEANHFQLENIFEEGHEYHRKWQARFRRMGRLQGRWYCTSCRSTWWDVSPQRCVHCDADGEAIEYREVQLKDESHLIFGHADGEVMAADWETSEDGEDVLIEIKSIGEGTIRMEMPRLLMQHTHEVSGTFGKTEKVLNTRGVWKDITSPFGPHLRQGRIYLRLRAMAAAKYGLAPIERICFVYEFKPTSMVKAFYVTRDDETVQELWDSAADIVYALDQGGRPPRCVDRDGPCARCKTYEDQESEHDGRATQTSGEVEGEPRRRRATREGEPAHPATPADGRPRAARRPDGPRGRVADRPAGVVHEVGGLLGRAARRRGD